MKRICSLVLVLTLVLSCFSSLSITASAVSGGALSSNITWELDADGVLTVSGNGAMPEFSEDEPSPFSSLSGVKRVVLSEGITSVGSYTFFGCAELKLVNLPSSITEIGLAAFLGCSLLKTISVDENNMFFSADNGVLFSKDKKTLVQYPAGKTLTSYTIPDGVTYIEDAAFAYCNRLQSVVFSDSVKNMGFAVFLGCSNLSTVELGNNLTSIGELSFVLCNSLYSIVIPDSVTSIGSNAFSECECLSSVVLGSGVKNIESNAFYFCSQLESVVIPDSVETIGEDAFRDCEKLENIIISDNVKIIGRNAFGGTAYYNNQDNWENEVLYINNHLIKAKTTLSGVYSIKNGTKTITADAFSNCVNITYVSIPDSVTELGDSAFYNCTKLAKITLSKNITQIKRFCFYNCDALTSVELPEGVTTIDNYAFNNCGKLTSMVLPKSVETVGNNAFYDSRNLKYIFYSGSEEEWADITVESNNAPFENAIVHYNSNDHLYYTEVVAQTCTEDGYIKTACSVCGIADYEILFATGHDFSTQWVVDVEPSASGNGEKSHHCLICDERKDVTPLIYNADIFNIVFAETDGFNSAGEITYKISLKKGVGVLGSIFGVVFDPSVMEPVEDKSGAVGVVDEDGNQIDNFTGIFMDGLKNSTEDTYIVAHTNTKETTKNRDLGYVQFTFRLKNPEAKETSVILSCFEFTGTPQIPSNEGVFVSSFVNEVPSATDKFTFEADADGTGYILTGCDKNVTGAVEIPEAFNGLPVTAIGTDAFRDCTEITSVVIPDSVVSVGGSAFRNCTKLTDIDLSDNITSIPGAMCFGCASLENVVIPQGVISVGGFAFSGCTALKEAVVPQSAVNIGGNAFADCNSLIIYCNKNSEADKYALANNLAVVTCIENTSVDIITGIIYTDVQGGGFEDIITSSDNVSCVSDSSCAGTGAVVEVKKDGTAYSQFTLVVFGDTNGDSVCDVLDCFSVERASDSHEELSGVYLEAGDINSDGIIDSTDYQAIVNKAMAS